MFRAILTWVFKLISGLALLVASSAAREFFILVFFIRDVQAYVDFIGADGSKSAFKNCNARSSRSRCCLSASVIC